MLLLKQKSRHDSHSSHRACACSSSKAQMLHAAEYYFQHLDGRIPLVVLSESSDHQSTCHSNPTATQGAHRSSRQASDAHTPAQHAEDLLDSLLGDEASPMFDLTALEAAVSTTPDDAKASLNACMLCHLPVDMVSVCLTLQFGVRCDRNYRCCVSYLLGNQLCLEASSCTSLRA